ncbi:hypothetical protein CS8_025950 [Cupriavidus sp. 8B]
MPALSWAAEVHKDAAGFLTLSDKAIAEDFTVLSVVTFSFAIYLIDGGLAA